jgi:hypothetical protein
VPWSACVACRVSEKTILQIGHSFYDIFLIPTILPLLFADLRRTYEARETAAGRSSHSLDMPNLNGIARSAS